MKTSIWVERYRPKTIADVIFQDDRQRKQFEAFVSSKDIPHLFLTGVQGTGKTTVSRALVNDLGVEPSDVLKINCSDEKIDAMRSKVTNFAMSMPLGKFKVVRLEECLQKDTLVRVLRGGKEIGVAIKDVNPDTDLVRSHDEHGTTWKKCTKKYQGKRKLVKITFSNGDVVLATENHPWVKSCDQTILTSDLSAGEEIFSPPINKLSSK